MRVLTKLFCGDLVDRYSELTFALRVDASQPYGVRQRVVADGLANARLGLSAGEARDYHHAIAEGRERLQRRSHLKRGALGFRCPFVHDSAVRDVDVGQ